MILKTAIQQDIEKLITNKIGIRSRNETDVQDRLAVQLHLGELEQRVNFSLDIHLMLNNSRERLHVIREVLGFKVPIGDFEDESGFNEAKTFIEDSNEAICRLGDMVYHKGEMSKFFRGERANI